MYIPDLAVKFLSGSVPNTTLVFFSLLFVRCPHFVNVMPHRTPGRKGGHKESSQPQRGHLLEAF